MVEELGHQQGTDGLELSVAERGQDVPVDVLPVVLAGGRGQCGPGGPPLLDQAGQGRVARPPVASVSRPLAELTLQQARRLGGGCDARQLAGRRRLVNGSRIPA